MLMKQACLSGFFFSFRQGENPKPRTKNRPLKCLEIAISTLSLLPLNDNKLILHLNIKHDTWLRKFNLGRTTFAINRVCMIWR